MDLNRNNVPGRKLTTLYIKDIPRELKRQFKAVCARRGTTMKAALLKFMLQQVEEENK